MGVCHHPGVLKPIEPEFFEQFFRRSSSGDWLYVGYGPDISGRVVSFDEMDWLMGVLPKLSVWKRWTVACFSVPLSWLVGGTLSVYVLAPQSPATRWLFPRMRYFALAALLLFVGFIVSTAFLALQPVTREFGRLLSKLPKEDSIGFDRFLKNMGAVNGPWITFFLMVGLGLIFVPGAFRSDMAAYFFPFSAVWAWCFFHAWRGATWKPGSEEES